MSHTVSHAEQANLRSGQAPHSGWQAGALQAIFAVFLGIILAFVVGVGVSTFYPNPASETREQLDTLYQQQDSYYGVGKGATTDLTAAQRAEAMETEQQIMVLDRVAQEQEQDWARTASIIVIAIATLLLAAAVGLARVERAWVFSTGLLLGGIFSMLFGVGLSMAAGESAVRFWVLAVALLITSGLGYLRFVRSRKPVDSVTVAGAASQTAELASVEQRLGALEQDMAAVRQAFRG